MPPSLEISRNGTPLHPYLENPRNGTPPLPSIWKFLGMVHPYPFYLNIWRHGTPQHPYLEISWHGTPLPPYPEIQKIVMSLASTLLIRIATGEGANHP